MDCLRSCLLVLPVVGLFGCADTPQENSTNTGQLVQSDGTNPAAPNSEKDTQPEKKPTDDDLRKSILGNWERHSYGKRVLTVKDDGTATMVVTPDGLWSFVIGERVEIEIEWNIENGRVIFDSVRGTPESSFNTITKLFGKHRDRRIVELNDERLVLLNDEDNRSEWKRVKSNEN